MAQFDVVRVFLFVVSARNGFGYVFFEHALPRTGLRVRNSKAFWMRSLLLSVRRLDSAWCHHFVLLCFGKSVWIGSLEHLQGCRQGLHMIPCVTRAFFVEVLCWAYLPTPCDHMCVFGLCRQHRPLKWRRPRHRQFQHCALHHHRRHWQMHFQHLRLRRQMHFQHQRLYHHRRAKPQQCQRPRQKQSHHQGRPPVPQQCQRPQRKQCHPKLCQRQTFQAQPQKQLPKHLPLRHQRRQSHQRPRPRAPPSLLFQSKQVLLPSLEPNLCQTCLAILRLPASHRHHASLLYVGPLGPFQPSTSRTVDLAPTRCSAKTKRFGDVLQAKWFLTLLIRLFFGARHSVPPLLAFWNI